MYLPYNILKRDGNYLIVKRTDTDGDIYELLIERPDGKRTFLKTHPTLERMELRLKQYKEGKEL